MKFKLEITLDSENGTSRNKAGIADILRAVAVKLTRGHPTDTACKILNEERVEVGTWRIE